MVKYHISATTGRPNICRATKRQCPLGGEEDHYPTKEAARKALEAKDAKTYETFPKTAKLRPGEKAMKRHYGPPNESWVKKALVKKFEYASFDTGKPCPHEDKWGRGEPCACTVTASMNPSYSPEVAEEIMSTLPRKSVFNHITGGERDACQYEVERLLQEHKVLEPENYVVTGVPNYDGKLQVKAELTSDFSAFYEDLKKLTDAGAPNRGQGYLRGPTPTNVTQGFISGRGF